MKSRFIRLSNSTFHLFFFIIMTAILYFNIRNNINDYEQIEPSSTDASLQKNR